MKVALAVHHFPPSYTGGAEWEAYHTAQALIQRGYSVRVVCVERIDRGPADGVTWVDDSYQGVPVRRLSYRLASAPDPVRWEYDNLWIGAHLRDWIAEWQPDLFHLMGGYLLSGRALRAAREAGLPTVLSLMDFWFVCRRIAMWRSNDTVSTFPIDPVRCAQCLGEEQRRFRWLGAAAPGLMRAYWQRQHQAARQIEERWQFLQETLAGVNVIVCRSQFVREAFARLGTAPQQLHFLRQGRDFPHLSPDQLRKSPTASLRIGYLGQIAVHKGVHVLLEAARRLPAAALSVRLFGNPKPFPDYTTRLQRLMDGDPRLQWGGTYRTADELAAILRELDVVVVPSVWYENSPNVILEAFAHRTPVIVSNHGGMAELVQEGENGLRFAPGDPADLARALQRLLDEPDLLPHLTAGLKPVPGIAAEMDALEGLYQQAMEAAHAARH